MEDGGSSEIVGIAIREICVLSAEEHMDVIQIGWVYSYFDIRLQLNALIRDIFRIVVHVPSPNSISKLRYCFSNDLL